MDFLGFGEPSEEPLQEGGEVLWGGKWGRAPSSQEGYNIVGT